MAAEENQLCLQIVHYLRMKHRACPAWGKAWRGCWVSCHCRSRGEGQVGWVGPESSSRPRGAAKGPLTAAAAAARTWHRGLSGAPGGGSCFGFRRKRRPSQVEPESERFRLAAAARPGPAEPSWAEPSCARGVPPLASPRTGLKAAAPEAEGCGGGGSGRRRGRGSPESEQRFPAPRPPGPAATPGAAPAVPRPSATSPSAAPPAPAGSPRPGAPRGRWAQPVSRAQPGWPRRPATTTTSPSPGLPSTRWSKRRCPTSAWRTTPGSWWSTAALSSSTSFPPRPTRSATNRRRKLSPRNTSYKVSFRGRSAGSGTCEPLLSRTASCSPLLSSCL